MTENLRTQLCYALVGIGLIQSIGFMTQQAWLKGIGALTVASPLPIVFTQVKGVETFALNFELSGVDASGQEINLPITPAVYGQFDAPYNFRNVIGAAVSYGPVMSEPIRNTVLSYAFQSPGALSKAIGFSPPLSHAQIDIHSRTHNDERSWSIKINDSRVEP